eukprot:scaffold111635_cov36-Tisochrysis_lutea.AAC.1
MEVKASSLPPQAGDEEADASASSLKQELHVEELQQKLGLVAQREERETKWGAAEAHDEFLAKRRALYAGEAELAGINAALPDGWTAYRARSEPHDVYYVNDVTGEAVWDPPTQPAVATDAEE